MTILIIEDDVGLAKLIKKRLANTFDTHVVTKGKEALEWLGDNGASLLLLDYQLSDMTGNVFVEKLVELKLTTPFIIMTGHGDEKIAVEMMKLGARDYLVKDSNFLELLPAVVKQVLDQIAIERSLDEARQALQESEERYRTLFQTMIQGVVYQDAQGKIITANPAAEKIFSTPLDKLLERELTELPIEFINEEGVTLTPQDFPAYQVLQTGRELKNMVVGLVRSQLHNVKWVNISAVPQFRPNETKPFRVYTTFYDITERRINEVKMAAYTAEIEHKNLELQLVHNKIKEDIEKARQIHRLFLPRENPELENYVVAAHYQPAEKMGGDFYNAVKIGDRQLLLCIADVTGHGLDGAMLTIFIRETINTYISLHGEKNKSISPFAVLNFLAAKFIQEGFPDEYFICVFIGVLDLESNLLTYSNGGLHIEPMLITAAGALERLSCTGPLISATIDEKSMVFSECQLLIRPGDTVLFTTDGLVEEIIDGQIYGEETLIEGLMQHHKLPAELVLELLKERFYSYSGTNQGSDDITILALQYPQVKDKLSLEVASDFLVLEGVLEKVSHFLTPYAKDLEQLLIGINELVTNGIEHGNKRDKNKKLKLTIHIVAGYVRIDIADEGKGFQWQNKIEKTLDLDNFAERGRGIIITKLCCDYLYYNPQGNRVTMIKLLEV